VVGELFVADKPLGDFYPATPRTHPDNKQEEHYEEGHRVVDPLSEDRLQSVAGDHVLVEVSVEIHLIVEGLDVVPHPEADREVEQRRKHQDLQRLAVQGLVEHGRRDARIGQGQSFAHIEHHECGCCLEEEDRESGTKHEGDEHNV
jgi:hypothetical protein